ncbi:MAG: YgjV family protein [Clostridia bacterium]|nr:YgjV family protein [Clostridia bacterium]
MEIIAQVLSIIGMIGTVFAFQIKKTSHFCIMSVFTCSLFATSYLLLGSPTSAIINLVCAIRGILASNSKTKKKLSFGIICLAIIGVTALTFNGILSVLVCVAELVGTFAMWFATEIGIRKYRIFIQSPLWLINNVCVFTIGGIICELFSMVSAIIFWIRMTRKNKA